MLAYFKPRSDKRLSDDAKVIEGRFAAQRDVKLGGTAIANAQVNAQVGHDLGHADGRDPRQRGPTEVEHVVAVGADDLLGRLAGRPVDLLDPVGRAKPGQGQAGLPHYRCSDSLQNL